MSDPRLPGALLKLVTQWSAHMDRDGRKWFRIALKKILADQDFMYPNGKTDVGDRLPLKPEGF